MIHPRKKTRKSASATSGQSTLASTAKKKLQRELSEIGREQTTNRRIIRAAAEVYREYGYERASMIEIAKRLGMTAPALYRHFDSKEQILVAFLEHAITDLTEFVSSFLHSAEPRRRLWEFLHAYVLWQLQQQEFSAAAYGRMYALVHLRNSVPAKQRQRIRSLERTLYEICRDIVAKVDGGSIPSGEVAPLAFSLFGMIEHLVTWFLPNGSLTATKIATLYADLGVAMVAEAAQRHRATAKDDPH